MKVFTPIGMVGMNAQGEFVFLPIKTQMSVESSQPDPFSPAKNYEVSVGSEESMEDESGIVDPMSPEEIERSAEIAAAKELSLAGTLGKYNKVKK